MSDLTADPEEVDLSNRREPGAAFEGRALRIVSTIASLLATPLSAFPQTLRSTSFAAAIKSALPATLAELSVIPSVIIPSVILLVAALVFYRRRSRECPAPRKQHGESHSGDRRPSFVPFVPLAEMADPDHPRQFAKPSETLLEVFQARPEIVTLTPQPEAASHLATPGITSISLTDPIPHRSIPEIVTTGLPSPIPYTLADFFETAPKPPASAFHRTERPPLPLREDTSARQNPLPNEAPATPSLEQMQVQDQPTQASELKVVIPFPEVPESVDMGTSSSSPFDQIPTARLTPYQRMKRRQVVPIRGKDGRTNPLSHSPEDSMQQK